MGETDKNNLNGRRGNGDASPGRYAYEGSSASSTSRRGSASSRRWRSNEAGLLFNDLKALCSLTDGNLSRQLQVLQEAGFVEVWKGIKNNRPQTLCRLTPEGRERFLEYIAVLE